MPRSPFGRPSPALVVSLLALVVAAAGTGIAAIPDGNGTFTGCYQASSDILSRIVVLAEPGESCPATYERITWNQTGPTGPAGPAGQAATPVRFHAFPDGIAGNAGSFRSFTLPAGSWVVLATATLHAQETTGALCVLSGPGGGAQQEVSNFRWQGSQPVSPFHHDAIVLQVAGTVSQTTTVTFACASIDSPARIEDIRVLAMPVSGVDTSVESPPLSRARVRALFRSTRVRFSRAAP